MVFPAEIGGKPDHLYILPNCSMNEKKYPICPDCGKSHYQDRGSVTTCIGRSPIYKDGVLVNKDPNRTTHTYHCLECNKDFSETK